MAAASTVGSANWTEEQHNVFVQLCVAEVVKGNRPNTSLNKEGWGNVHKDFTRLTGAKYTLKQLKNHWDAMKEDYKIFKKLKFGFSGLGWNEVTKTIEAPESWWKDRIAAHIYASYHQISASEPMDQMKVSNIPSTTLVIFMFCFQTDPSSY